MNFTFGREYKLKSKNIIDQIFESNNVVKEYPFVLKYTEANPITDKSFQIVISAPKRSFRHAVKRNRIKRLCTEAIRINKHQLESFLIEKDKKLGLFLIYTSKEEIPIKKLEQKMNKLFKKLIQKIDATK